MPGPSLRGVPSLTFPNRLLRWKEESSPPRCGLSSSPLRTGKITHSCHRGRGGVAGGAPGAEGVGVLSSSSLTCYSSWLFCTERCGRPSSTLAPEEPVCSGLAFLGLVVSGSLVRPQKSLSCPGSLQSGHQGSEVWNERILKNVSRRCWVERCWGLRKPLTVMPPPACPGPGFSRCPWFQRGH